MSTSERFALDDVDALMVIIAERESDLLAKLNKIIQYLKTQGYALNFKDNFNDLETNEQNIIRSFYDSLVFHYDKNQNSKYIEDSIIQELKNVNKRIKELKQALENWNSTQEPDSYYSLNNKIYTDRINRLEVTVKYFNLTKVNINDDDDDAALTINQFIEKLKQNLNDIEQQFLPKAKTLQQTLQTEMAATKNELQDSKTTADEYLEQLQQSQETIQQSQETIRQSQETIQQQQKKLDTNKTVSEIAGLLNKINELMDSTPNEPAANSGGRFNTYINSKLNRNNNKKYINIPYKNIYFNIK